MWVAFSILLTLAFVEVALAVLRDVIVAAGIELTRGLAGAEAAAAESGLVEKIPTVGQMILGFILPFALVFVAIPLEYFINSARTVVGVAIVLAIRALAFALRVVGNIVKQLGNLLVNVYDVLIFVPLLIERFIRSMRGGQENVEFVRSGEITSFPAKGRARA